MLKLLDRADLTVVASPIRRQLLDALGEPDSAINLARKFDMSRQRVGYHMRALERAGFLELVGERQHRGCTERLYRARRMTYLLEPGACGEADPQTLQRTQDRFSWAALLDLVTRMLRELVALRQSADASGKRLATLALETEVAFTGPSQRKAFTEELTDAVHHLIEKYHAERGGRARRYRVCVGAYPHPGTSNDTE